MVVVRTLADFLQTLSKDDAGLVRTFYKGFWTEAVSQHDALPFLLQNDVPLGQSNKAMGSAAQEEEKQGGKGVSDEAVLAGVRLSLQCVSPLSLLT